MTKVLAINGEFFCKNLTGIERVATDTLLVLDGLLPPGRVELVLPANAQNVPQYKNIKCVRLPVAAAFFPKWTQIHFQKYVFFNRRVSLDFSNTCPYFCPGIEFLHDIYARLYSSDFKSRRDKLIRLYSNIMYRRIAKKAKKIIAVSEYTKKTIVDRYKIDPARVQVIYDGLGSYKKIEPDFSVFERLPQLNKKEFYFTLGSLSTRKNLKWIAENARLFPDALFAVSGKPLPSVVPPELEALKNLPNVLMTGYLSDGEVKALLSKCKAFVFPTYFEGFGLPPLEALSCGAPIVISNRTSLPEIYGASAHYIDPDNPNVDIAALLKEPVEPADEVLKKFTVENSARQLAAVIAEVLG
ncbi:MAG: glycosyltransferase family 4 protein [Treponema sp.]|nr:glycosyltransferase family 4 protein [Treponema sp.]